MDLGQYLLARRRGVVRVLNPNSSYMAEYRVKENNQKEKDDKPYKIRKR